MPTGYTAGIEDGTITTGKEFLMTCARNFGALIHMREDSMDTEIKDRVPSDYYTKYIENATSELSDIYTMSDDEIEAQIELGFVAAIESNKKYYEAGEEKNRQYRKILQEVTDWIPPTSEHNNIKEFAISQIELCMDTYHLRYKDLVPDKLSIKEWREIQIESKLSSIKYYSKSKKQEEESCDKSNEWVNQLRESLTK
jgi:hypothetical protein